MEQGYRQEDFFSESLAQRREDKILAAKMAFGAGSSSQRSFPMKSGYEQSSQKQQEERKHQYGLWRFVITVMLFFAFMAGSYFDISYHGWNQKKLEKALSDDTKWQKVVREVSNVMEYIPGHSGK